MATSFPITKEDGRALFLAIGFSEKMVDKWTDEHLANKLEKMPDLYDGKKKIKDPKLAKLMVKLLKAIEDGKEVALQVTEEDETPPAKTAAKGKPGGKKAAPEPEEEDDTEDDEEEDESDEDGDESEDDEDDEEEESEETDDDGDSGEEEPEEEDDTEDDTEDDEEEESEETDDDDSDEAEDDEEEDESDEDGDESEDDEDDEEDDEVVTTKTPPKKGGGNKPAAKANGKPAAAPVKSGGGKIEKAGPAGGLGILGTAIEKLSTLTAETAMSKAKITDYVMKKLSLPESRRESVASTIKQNVPTKLRREKGLDVRKNDKGFWIPIKGAGKKTAAPPAKGKDAGKKATPPPAKGKKK